MKTLTINGIAELIKLSTEFNLSIEALLKGSKITTACLSDPHAVIHSDQEIQVINNLVNLVKLDHLGLIIGDRFPLSVLGILGAAVPNADNVRQAICFFIRHISLSYTYFDIDFEEGTEGATVTFNDNLALCHLKRFFIDRDIMFTVKALRDILGRPLIAPNIAIELGYPSPDFKQPYEDYLGKNLRFNCAHTKIHISRNLLETPLPQSNALTLAVLEEQCIKVKNRNEVPERISDKVKNILKNSLSSPPSLEEIADKMYMSSRNLRRKLELEGSPFLSTLNTLRYEEASRLLLQTNLSIEKISAELGYSETASFNHAFKRWSGHSPSQFRKIRLNKAEK